MSTPLPRRYFCQIVSGAIRRRLKIPVANLHVRHLRQQRWNLGMQNSPDKRWEQGRNKRGNNKIHRPKSNPLVIPREWMPQRGSCWSCPSNPTQVEGPLEPFWSWDRDWTSHLAPTVLHIGPRTRPYSAAWARGCWKFVAKLFRPTLVSLWFHFFIKVTAGTGGDPLSCLWNRQCRAHSIGLYNARVGVNSNPTGFFSFLLGLLYHGQFLNSSFLRMVSHVAQRLRCHRLNLMARCCSIWSNWRVGLFSSILHQVVVTLLFAGEILETCGVMVSCPSKVRFNFL